MTFYWLREKLSSRPHTRINSLREKFSSSCCGDCCGTDDDDDGGGGDDDLLCDDEYYDAVAAGYHYHHTPKLKPVHQDWPPGTNPPNGPPTLTTAASCHQS